MQRKLLIASLLVLSATGMVASQSLSVAPGNEHFQRTWQRIDRPVADGIALRTWLWAPEAFTDVLVEPYVESPGGKREVQYFDKSRMEISDPTADTTATWYVTNGLLVGELTTGRMQFGDTNFEQRTPAEINVAGDNDDPTGPTYATFGSLVNAPPASGRTPIQLRVDRAGNVTVDTTLFDQNITVSVLDEVTNHSIATPFWDFMNSSGTVYEDGQFVSDLLFENPYFATGRPITEAYWAKVKVAGSYKDVLVQCFERRCLTYTPANPVGWQVEAGNIGQHYFQWRYGGTGNELPGTAPTATPGMSTTATSIPTPTTAPTATATPTVTATAEQMRPFAPEWIAISGAAPGPTNSCNFISFVIELQFEDRSDNEDGFILEDLYGNETELDAAKGVGSRVYITHFYFGSAFDPVRYGIRAFNEAGESDTSYALASLLQPIEC